LIAALVELRERQGIDLAVIDSLASFLPGRTENLAAVMMECLLLLRRLTECGLGVLLLHHPRKGAVLGGQAARGSGALTAFVDILIEMYWYSEPESSDRRRRLHAYARDEATRRHLVIELNAEGNDYRVHEAAEDEASSDVWQGLEIVLEEAVQKLTRQGILEQWPDDIPKPNEATVWRRLQRAVANGLVLKEGTGRKRAPFRYWLPGTEDKLMPPPEAGPEAMHAWNRRIMEDFLEGLTDRRPLSSQPPTTGTPAGQDRQTLVVPTAGAKDQPSTEANVGDPRVDGAKVDIVRPAAPVVAMPSNKADGSQAPSAPVPTPAPVPVLKSVKRKAAPPQAAPKPPPAPAEPSVEAERLRSRRWPQG
jgi:hypothetical protein